MKLAARIFVVAGLSACCLGPLSGCGSNATNSDGSAVEQSKEKKDSRETFEYDGVTLKYDSSWTNFGAALAPDGDNGQVYVKTYADGRTASLDAYASTLSDSADFADTSNFQVVKQWEIDGGTTVVAYASNRSGDGQPINYVLGFNADTNCGFVISVLRGDDDTVKIDDKTFDDLIDSIEYDPSKSTQAEKSADLQSYRAQSGTETVGDYSESAPKTAEQEQARGKAQRYLNQMAFSRKGLIGQLAYDGFSNDDATWGVDHCGADWNEQAGRMAQSYLGNMDFTREELIGQLEHDGFSAQEAEYGVSAAGL